jgi:hypothetical protein
MYTIKDGKSKEITNIYAVKDAAVKTITNVYSIIKGKAVLIWTAIKDAISGVFSQGYWQNTEEWNNQDMWKNEP